MPRTLGITFEESRMADLLTDDGYAWVVDDARLEEIALLTRMMIEATGHTGPLTQAQIDELLVRAPIVAVPGLGWQDVPAPRTEARTG
jgi:hypothetical protein